MKTKYGLTVMALAMVCLMALPALAADSYQADSSPVIGGFTGANNWMLLVDDAARDNFENMTLAQIDELKQQKMQELENMTLAQIDELRQKKMQELDNTILAQIKEMGGMGFGMMNDGRMGPGMAGIGGYSPDGQAGRQMGGHW